MSGGAAVVEVENLVRDYVTGGARGAARRVRALNGVSLAVPRGTLFGLLGPNGAGKTTMVKVLTTVITPTAGSARVFGFDVVREAHRIRPRLGVAYGGELGLYWRLNGLDNLVFAGQLQGMGPKEARARAWALLERFGLAGAARQRVDGYSRGMRQRLHLARCLMHDPELLFLDEPTTGLDPAAARDVRQLILELKAAGKTVFLTTHNMGEADSLCDRVAILARGALVTVGSPAELKRSLEVYRLLEVTVAGGAGSQAEAIRRRMGLPEEPGVLTCEPTERGTVVRLRYRGVAPVQALLAALGEEVAVLDIATRESTLEEAYLRLVEERGA